MKNIDAGLKIAACAKLQLPPVLDPPPRVVGLVKRLEPCSACGATPPHPSPPPPLTPHRVKSSGPGGRWLGPANPTCFGRLPKHRKPNHPHPPPKNGPPGQLRPSGDGPLLTRASNPLAMRTLCQDRQQQHTVGSTNPSHDRGENQKYKKKRALSREYSM